MVTNLAEKNSVANRFVAELRDIDIQQDRLRFRHNLERLGQIMAYEISKTLDYEPFEIETPLGVASAMLPAQRIVLATILRAGLPMHDGMLHYFDQADNVFVAACRRNQPDGSFDIQLDYISTPDLTDAVLILCDPMLATGASINLALEKLAAFGQPETIHIAAVIASTAGLEAVRRQHPDAHVWMAALDEELTAKAYIVPGLGDAGDLAFGEKKD